MHSVQWEETGSKPGNIRVVAGIPIPVRMAVAGKNDGIVDPRKIKLGEKYVT